MDNTPDSPAKTPVGYTTQGGNYWTLITPEIWKVLHAVLHANRLEGEWRAANCRLLPNLNQTCDVRSNSKIIFGSDNIQFLISGTLDRRDDGVRYVDAGNRTDVYVGNQKQATHVFENSNRMYVDSPTQRFYFDRSSVGHTVPSTSASTSSVPYGIWKASHCEYFKDGALRFPRLFVCQRVSFMLPVFPSAAH